MKPVIAFLASFVVATAAATGASVALHKGHVRPADSSAVADTAAKDSTAGDSAARASGDSAKAKTDSASTATAAPETPAAQGTAVSVPAKSGKIDVVDSANASERRVAKLFSSMQPADAAKALEHMTDNDVQVILGYVGTRQAAAILAAMPADRVATISKLALHGKGQ